MSGSGWKYSLYYRMPILLQNLIVSIQGYLLFRQRYGKAYKEYLSCLRNKDYSILENEESNQEREFIEFLNFAYDNSPFYGDFYKGIDIKGIKSLDDMTKLPVLEKDILRKNIERVFTTDKDRGIQSFTGGTTGKSLMVMFTREDFQKRMAYLDFFKEKLGVHHGMRRATFSGRQIVSPNQKSRIYWRYNLILRQKLYSTFNLSIETIPLYIEDLNKFKPEQINGFVSAIYDIAKYVVEHKVELGFKPRAIFTTSESLLGMHREVIEKAFGCPVYDQYASAEGAPFITECKNRRLHYHLDTGVIEAYPTEFGTEMLVTSFTSHGTPLIRYRIGDKIEFSNEKCDCGCCHPVVKRIEGRQVDYLLAGGGRKVSLSHLADVIKGMPNGIVKMQFVQNSMDEIDIKIVPDTKTYKPAYDSFIRNEMIYRFGKDMTFNIIKVDNIEKEKGGKYRLIKNNIG